MKKWNCLLISSNGKEEAVAKQILDPLRSIIYLGIKKHEETPEDDFEEDPEKENSAYAHNINTTIKPFRKRN